jgi:dipeptidase E
MPLALLLLTLTTSHAHPHHHRRVYAAGSGSMFKSQPDTVREVIALSGVGDHRTPSVLYLGTATYDDPAPMHSQTSGFADVGCAVSALDVAVRTPPASEMAAALAAADIIVISGGNTLFAVDRWVATGLDGALRNALARGVVLCGGSAGFISLCDGGHSDSMQPDSYKNPPGNLPQPRVLLPHAYSTRIANTNTTSYLPVHVRVSHACTRLCCE